MAVVPLNYLPPSVRVAVFMSAAKSDPPPPSLGPCLFYNAAPCRSLSRGQLTRLARADSRTEHFLFFNARIS